MNEDKDNNDNNDDTYHDSYENDVPDSTGYRGFHDIFAKFDPENVPESMQNCPITCYFLETKHLGGEENWNTMEWLKNIDLDTLNMIAEAILKMNNISPNMSLKAVFNHPDFKDIFLFSDGLMIAEMGLQNYLSIEPTILGLKHAMVVELLHVVIPFETLRRKDLIRVAGTGRITDIAGIYVRETELGHAVMEELKKNMAEHGAFPKVDEIIQRVKNERKN